MARMLQALKNLEARAVKPGLKRPTAPAPVVERPQEAKSPIRVVTAQVEELLAIESMPLESAVYPPQPLIVSAEPEIDAMPFMSRPAIRAPLETVRTPEAANVRPATNFERRIRRMLSDPVLRQPFFELVERLNRDIEQTSSRTIALLGVGQSATHEAAMGIAVRLAEQATDEVLLLDADLSRVPLSEALERGRERGVAEYVRGGGLARDFCRPTAIGRLAFLPGGQLRHLDLSTAGSRVEELLKELSTEYASVLIHGGRTSELGATALARMADATYLVVELGTVETSEAQAALRDVRAAGARVLGCIAT